MFCSRCKVKMIEQKRSYHKQRKWVCPQCGAARMQAQKPRPPRRSRGAEK
jgi:DNA-directed RNA polymerase subunit RPC12/RpoP